MASGKTLEMIQFSKRHRRRTRMERLVAQMMGDPIPEEPVRPARDRDRSLRGKARVKARKAARRA